MTLEKTITDPLIFLKISGIFIKHFLNAKSFSPGSLRIQYSNDTCGWQCDCCYDPSRGISPGVERSEKQQYCGCSWDTRTLCFSTGCTLAQKCLHQAGPRFLKKRQKKQLDLQKHFSLFKFYICPHTNSFISPTDYF